MLKLITYIKDNTELYGVLNNNYVYSMVDLLEDRIKKIPEDMNAFVEMHDSNWWKIIKKRIRVIKGSPLEDVHLISPIPRPRRDIICVGENYYDHIEEVKDQLEEGYETVKRPIFFIKRARQTVPYNGDVHLHEQVTDAVDYEVELAVIIGKSGINIEYDEAKSHIFGYTIANDVSARDLQLQHKQWFKGKSLETFCPLGPYLVPKGELENLSLEISSSVNGQLRQCSNTDHMIFDVYTLISILSKGMYLEAGDIILTGTPSGVGMGMKPPSYLKKGDVVECRIDNLGCMRNTFI